MAWAGAPRHPVTVCAGNRGAQSIMGKAGNGERGALGRCPVMGDSAVELLKVCLLWLL